MKIKVKANGRIETVVRDNNIELENGIIIEDNEDVILNPDKYLYLNGNLILRPYVVIETDKVDTNGNGISDSDLEHNLTIKFYNSDGSIDESINGNYILRIFYGQNSFNDYNINIINGIGSYNLTKNFIGIAYVGIVNFDGYINSLVIEFI